MSVKTKVDEKLFYLIDKLPEYEDGSDQKAAILKEISELHKLRVEELKLITEEEKALKESERSEKEAKWKIFDRVGHVVIELTAIGVPAGVYLLCFKNGLLYEKDGTVGSLTVRNLFSKQKITR